VKTEGKSGGGEVSILSSLEGLHESNYSKGREIGQLKRISPVPGSGSGKLG